MAANDICVPGSSAASGVSASTTTAATPTERSDRDGRPTSTPASTSPVITKERCAGTSLPDSTR